MIPRLVCLIAIQIAESNSKSHTPNLNIISSTWHFEMQHTNAEASSKMYT